MFNTIALLCRHLNTRLAGLARIAIPAELLKVQFFVDTESQSPDARIPRRLITADAGTDADMAVNEYFNSTIISANLTDNNARGTIYEQVDVNATPISTFNQDYYLNNYNCAVKGIPVSFDDDVSKPKHIAEPVSLYDLLDQQNLVGAIKWPSSTDSVSIDEFAASPVIERSQLQEVT